MISDFLNNEDAAKAETNDAKGNGTTIDGTTIDGTTIDGTATASAPAPTTAIPTAQKKSGDILIPTKTSVEFIRGTNDTYNGVITMDNQEIQFGNVIISKDGKSNLTGATFSPRTTIGGSRKRHSRRTKRKRYLGKGNRGKSRRRK